MLRIVKEKVRIGGRISMKDKLHNPDMDMLMQAICTLESKEECYRFFEDICTMNELQSFSQRFQVAKMLWEHNVYTEISKETGASTATISRVKRTLDYGNDGYELAFRRMNKEQ